MARFTIMGSQGFIGTRLSCYLRRRNHEVLTPLRGQNPRGAAGHLVYCIGLTADFSQRPFDTVDAHTSLFASVLRDTDFESCTYLSSTRLYDSQGGISAAEEQPLLLEPRNSRHLYDLSKALSESLGFCCGRNNVRVARLACVYDDDHDSPGFLHELMRGVFSGRFEVNSYCNVQRDYVHISKVCEAIERMALRGESFTYNVASGRNTSNAEIFNCIEANTGISIRHLGSLTPEPLPVCVDVTRMREELGITPRSVLDDIAKWLGERNAN